MKRSLYLFLVVAMFTPSLILAATQGKVRGKVVDSESGEALVGAAVLVVGTSFGSTTDANGEFTILKLEVGTYSLKASYIGYQAITIENVRVNADLTSEVNFKLPAEGVQVTTVIVTADRPLVNKSATNSIRIVDGQTIQNIPTRGYLDIVALQPGVVRVGNNVYVRGGRTDEVAYAIDGMIVNNPYNSLNAGTVVNESIEEVTFQAGGFNAEYGFANAGLVSTTTKTGTSKYEISVGAITDEFLPQTKAPTDPLERIEKGRQAPSSLMSYGTTIYHLSVGGPIPGTDDQIKFHIGTQYTGARDGTPSAGRDYIIPDNSLFETAINSNVTFNFSPFDVRVGGFSSSTRDRVVSALHSVFNSERNRKRNQLTHAYNVRLTHTLGTSTYYSAQASWFQTETEQGDPMWFDDIDSYGDPAKNPILKNPTTGDPTPGRNPANVFHNLFAGKGYVNFFYSYNQSSYLGGKLDLVHQIGNDHLLKGGGEVRYNTIRFWQVNPDDFATVRAANPGYTREEVLRNAYTNNLGMAVEGVKKGGSKTVLDNGRNGAPHPIIAAGYVQDKMELEDLVLNLGLRFDYINANVDRLKDPSNIVILSDPSLPYKTIAESNYEAGEANVTISPRLGFSFPVTDRIVFHSQYGKFVQQPELNRLYTSTTILAQQLSAGNFVTVGNPDLKPEKTTSYEVGFSQQISDFAGFDITAFYKDVQDLVQLQNIIAQPVAYARFVNGDYGTIKGLSFSFDLRRTERVSGTINYTLQYASGTGSAANDNFNIAWLGGNFPTFVSPLDFDQRHTGSINVDFRTTPEDGPEFFDSHPLGRVGVNLLLSFGSGRPYTPAQAKTILFGPTWETPTAAMNQTYSPWNFQLDMKIDKTLTIGPVDVNVYLWALNVLNIKNVATVYNFTGLPDDDGYFKTAEGQAYAQKEGQEAMEGYRYRLGVPANYGVPRQIRLGVRVDFGS